MEDEGPAGVGVGKWGLGERGVRQVLATSPRLASNSCLSSHLGLLGTSRALELQLSPTGSSWFSFTCDLNDCFSKMTKKKLDFSRREFKSDSVMTI